MMADKTFGVKVSEEIYAKAQNLIDGSALTAKEWFERALTLVEVNDLKEGSPDFKVDINELEVHTTRIFELVVNMVQRANYLKESETKGLLERIEQKEITLFEYQARIKEYEANIQSLEDQIQQTEENKQELMGNLEEMRLTNVNNQELIKEYKEKIDSLSALIVKYKGFADENELLRAQYTKDMERLNSQIDELSASNQGYKSEVESYMQKNEILKRNHADELERIEEKKEYEKDRVLLDQEKIYQSQLAMLQDKHNKEIATLHQEYNERLKKLYEEREIMRKTFEREKKDMNEEKPKK